MKKWIPTLIVACALHVASTPALYAATLNDKIKTAKTELAAQSQKININKANATELQNLPGVGASKAAAIVAYRAEHGDFSTVADLTKVKGIGDKMISKISSMATVK